ncbi:MAG: 50S ribosomal protein L17, partial [Actinomycetota bacterium]|nr:50S ribosomal protein L17 [Actinomycetota bacterium]
DATETEDAVVTEPQDAPVVEAAEVETVEEPQDAPGVVEGTFGPDSAAPNEDGSAPAGFDIKGNENSMKFHEPDGQWYDQTIAEVWFRTPEAAHAAGFTKAGGEDGE